MQNEWFWRAVKEIEIGSRIEPREISKSIANYSIIYSEIRKWI